MSYQPRPFASQDTLEASKNQIRTNFQLLQTDFAVNHVPIGDTGEGKHKFLQMPEQSSAPATAANESGLYTKESNGRSTLFYRQESSGTEIQMTGADPLVASDGYTFLPGGLVLIWGSFTATGNGSTAVVFPGGLTLSANVYNVTLTLRISSNNSYAIYVQPGSLSTTGFTAVRNNADNLVTYYQAIGKI